MSDYYPPAAFSFAVWFAEQPLLDTAFSEVSGLDSAWQTVDVSEGGEPAPHKLPIRQSHGPVTMTRGLMLGASPLFLWCQATMENPLSAPIRPQDVIVALLGEERRPLMSWCLSRAWPTGWKMDPFDASASKVAIERIEFACHGIARVPSTAGPVAGVMSNAG